MSPEHAQVTDDPGVRHELREATLRALVDANFAICYEWNLRDDSCLFSGHFDELLGLSTAEVPTTIDDWCAFVHSDDLAEVRRLNAEAIASGDSTHAEYRMVRRDGTVIVVEDSCLVLTDKNGEKSYMVGGLRDVTAERDAQCALEERNTALRVLLDQRRQDKTDLERNITSNLRRMVVPALDRLARSLRSRPESVQIEALRTTLEEIFGPFSRLLEEPEDPRARLTRREYEIVQLIRSGKTTAEIAETLHIGDATVTYHRMRIRRKLGLGPRSPQLSAHLASRMEPRDRGEALDKLLGVEGSQGNSDSG